jgi:hypothetical protein
MVLSSLLMMRPIHRPAISKLVYNADWLRMSEEEKKAAEAEGKIRLPEFSKMKTMSKKEREEFRDKLTPIFEEYKERINRVFLAIPRSLLLVCRFVNSLLNSIQ